MLNNQYKQIPQLVIQGHFLYLFSFFFGCAMQHSSWTRPGLEPVAPALGEWSLNHWTTREIPEAIFFFFARAVWHAGS